MASTQIFIVQDDNQGKLDRLSLGGNWTSKFEFFFFDGGASLPQSTTSNVSTGPRTSIKYTFDGTSIGIWGLTAPQGHNEVFQVTIDDNAPYNTSNAAPFYYTQWFQSPQLGEGQHTVQLDLVNASGQYLDYMVVTPSNSTPLGGQTLMVDDSYNGIQYSKGWQLVENSTFEGDAVTGDTVLLGDGTNFMNTTHRTRTIGDTMTFSYTGTVASVYGVALTNVPGSLTFTYAIDGANFSSHLISSGVQNNPNDSLKQSPNFQFFNTGPLVPGNHTLTVTLTDVGGDQTLIIDYITYLPSFGTLASMPNLTASSASSSPNSKSHAGAIAGGVIGGVALLVIAVSLLWWLCRSKSVNRAKSEISEHRNSTLLDPYMVTQPSHAQGSPPMSDGPDTNQVLVTVGRKSPPSSAPNHGPSVQSSGSTEPESYQQLQRRVEQLTTENAHLAAQADGGVPPAYHSS